MTRLALLADLHFGSVPEGLENLLLEDIASVNPEAVLIGGDLTMAATEGEFKKARAWLDKLDIQRLVIPGNHDIPKFNLIERFRRPFDRFERTIRQDERKPLSLELCHVVGLNTVAPWQPHFRWQEGRVKRKTMKLFSQTMEETPSDKFRIVLAHHPFAKVPEMERARPVRRAKTMLGVFHETDVDLVLSGHTHQSFILPLDSKDNYLIAVGAPTALSSRTRGEENGYWLIDISEDKIALSLRLRDGNNFKSGEPTVCSASDFKIKRDTG